MKEFMEAIGWPHISLILGVLFLFMFKSQIGNFISRVKSVSKDGVLTENELTPQGYSEKPTDIIKHIEVEKTIMLDEVEKAIFEDIKSRDLEYDNDTVKVVVRNLAVTQINLDHEQTYNLIFGSQINLLKLLNEVVGTGRDDGFLEGYYLSIKERHTEAYSNWELVTYLTFLKERSLITFENNMWHISNKGIDFLLWLVKHSKKENKPY